jgi:site-specific recombinase XerD
MNSIEQYLQSKGLGKTTITCYNNEIIEFIVWCDMQNIEPEITGSTDVTAYLQHLKKKGQQNKTRNVNLGILKHYFDYLIHTQQREDNPAKAIKIRGTKTKNQYPIFSKQELESIHHNYTLLEETSRNNSRNWFEKSLLSRQRNKTILSLMIYQGLATDEVNRLTLQDVKLKEGTLFIAGTRKSNERELALKPQQVMELMEYQLTTRAALLKSKTAASQTQLYFIASPGAASPAGKTEDGINIWKRLSQEIKTTHKKFINFRQVRASVITHWLQQYNLRQVQYMAGHRYISSTESYLSNNMEELQNDIDQYHPIV